ncbi:hypothetical protein [Bradyrhizobium icense]|uniref:Uncharacterized protein n=1 Tax=Bradyrhizobium icense TaxID=1274631 RepID=A0A1B1UD31_9BRAD|nr:hypothetical protein [Bradyrhizobium icense]ANW00658.1 hypothetical protein LMTR13_11265 [Bradyrhizobium icense]
MPFVKIKNATANFSKPRDWNEKEAGPCGDLWVRQDKYGPYTQFSFAWRPDAGQLKLLNAGGALEINIINDYMPPVGVSAVHATEESRVGTAGDHRNEQQNGPPRPSSPPSHKPVG